MNEKFDRKVAGYQLFSADTAEKLSGEVVAALNDGWRPAGGVAVETQIQDGKTVRVKYLQAVFFLPKS